MPSYYFLNHPKDGQRVFRTPDALAAAVPPILRRDIAAEVRAMPPYTSLAINETLAVTHVVCAARDIEYEIEN